MNFFKKSYLIIFLILCLFNFSLNCQTTLDQKIKNISDSIYGQIGIAALHIESNKKFEFNGAKRFPMCSTYKIPIALCCLSLIEKKSLVLIPKKFLINMI